MIKIKRRDVLTPANAISLIGLAMTMYGAINITALHGVLLLGLGRLIDIFDGKLARATHTSQLGGLIDATCDKIGIVFLVTAIWVNELAPYWILIYVLLQNALNVLITLLSTFRGAETSSSKNGKYAMFMQNISLGAYALGSVINSSELELLGILLAVASLYWAFQATYGYLRLVPNLVK